MEFSLTPLQGLAVASTRRVRDHRGGFARYFCEADLAPLLEERRIVQINHSITAAVGAVRGMHYQRRPHAEMKLVRCLRGRVWDVALDLRRGSPTFLKWHAQELSADNELMMVIPEGFAHGFQVLEPDSELLYLHTAAWTPGAEGAVRHDETRVAIRWPLQVTDLSERDRSHPPLDIDFQGLAP